MHNGFLRGFFRGISQKNSKKTIENLIEPSWISDSSSPWSASALHPLAVKISNLLDELELEEIYLNHAGSLSYYETRGSVVHIKSFCNKTQLMEFIWSIAWQSRVRLDPLCPYAGGIIEGISCRWHAVIPPASPDGPTLVVRRQAFRQLTLKSFMFLNFHEDDFFRWLKNGDSVLFLGSTGSGKSSLLLSVLKSFFIEYRVGILESLLELPLLSDSWFRLIESSGDLGGRGAVDMDRILRELLRLSPKLIVLGEIRGSEALPFIELSRTGHGGIMSTMHAGNIEEAKTRLTYSRGIDPRSLPKIMGVFVNKDHNNIYRCRAERLC